MTLPIASPLAEASLGAGVTLALVSLTVAVLPWVLFLTNNRAVTLSHPLIPGYIFLSLYHFPWQFGRFGWYL